MRARAKWVLGLSDKSLASLIGEDEAFHDATVVILTVEVLQQQLRQSWT